MKPVITVKDLNLTYDLGKSNETVALKDINFEIYDGEYVVFFGPSGCGKSSLLYTIAGLETPTKGDVIVNGINLRTISELDLISFYRKTIGMVFQAYQLIPQFTARDNILLPLVFNATPKDEREAKADAVIGRFGLTEMADRRPTRLSGGQQQRTAIARSLMNDPLIVLADEPVGNLDTKNAQVVLDLLLDINIKEKKTVIYVTHNPRDLHYGHRVIYMKDGGIERIVRNSARVLGSDTIQTEPSEIERLAQVYPYLSELRLQSMLILNHFIAPYDLKIQEKIEEIISKYMKEEINKDQFHKLLNDPMPEGAGLYTQKAQDLTERIDKLVSEVKSVKEKELVASTIDERALSIRHYLLDEYTGHLSYDQIDRLGHFLRERLQNKLQATDLQKVLDLPLEQGGVGLNTRTAMRFSREVELILLRPIA